MPLWGDVWGSQAQRPIVKRATLPVKLVANCHPIKAYSGCLGHIRPRSISVNRKTRCGDALHIDKKFVSGTAVGNSCYQNDRWAGKNSRSQGNVICTATGGNSTSRNYFWINNTTIYSWSPSCFELRINRTICNISGSNGTGRNSDPIIVPLIIFTEVMQLSATPFATSAWRA